MAGIIEKFQKVAVVAGEKQLGEVSIAVERPRRFGAAAIIAHGAGGDMHTPLLIEVQHRLAEASVAAVRFNFLYSEKGRRAPDRTAALLACWRSVADWVRAELEPGTLFLGGKSMGGRMASYLAAEDYPCAGLFFLGYPLHPPGRKDQLRTDHLPAIRVPMLFISGSRDALCDLELLRPVVRSLRSRATLHVIDGGDHSFRLPKRYGRSEAGVTAEICDVLTRFLTERS